MSSAFPRSGPRERAQLEGIEVLSDAELVAPVLGGGSRGSPVLAIATALLADTGGVAGLARRGAGGMAQRRGIGAAKGSRLAAAIELGQRVRSAVTPHPTCLRDSDSVAAWACPRLGHIEHEELWVLALDGAKRLRAARCVARGGLHGVGVQLRDPLRAALREGASGIIVVHNHPSGDPSPSAEDVAFTHQLSVAARLVSTPLVDHVIVSGDAHVSMLSLGLLDAPRAPDPQVGK